MQMVLSSAFFTILSPDEKTDIRSLFVSSCAFASNDRSRKVSMIKPANFMIFISLVFYCLFNRTDGTYETLVTLFGGDYAYHFVIALAVFNEHRTSRITLVKAPA